MKKVEIVYAYDVVNKGGNIVMKYKVIRFANKLSVFDPNSGLIYDQKLFS